MNSGIFKYDIKEVIRKNEIDKKANKSKEYYEK